jgi:tetratricopeptide (TPR) repeat protein
VGFAVAGVALAWRWKPERRVAMILGVVLLCFTVRTFFRNPAWNDDLSLALADLPAAPNSFRPHDILGENLYFQNSAANLDRAIAELEISWSILRVLPPKDVFAAVPANLGSYYGLKGDRAGGLSTPEGRAWYEKSLAILVQARDATLASQKVYDDLQLRNGRPLPPLNENSSVFFYLGQAYMRLGRYAEGIPQYLQGRIVEAGNPVAYDTIVRAYLDHGDFESAAVLLQEKVLLFGASPQTLAALRNAYARIPEGACAIRRVNGIDQMDPGCPRIGGDTCKALADLRQVFTAARQESKAGWYQNMAGQYHCPVR